MVPPLLLLGRLNLLHVTLLKKTIETITEILMVSITNHQQLTIKTITKWFPLRSVFWAYSIRIYWFVQVSITNLYWSRFAHNGFHHSFVMVLMVPLQVCIGLYLHIFNGFHHSFVLVLMVPLQVSIGFYLHIFNGFRCSFVLVLILMFT